MDELEMSELVEYHGISTDTDGNLFIKLEPGDTELLYPGDYYYTIKIEHIDGTVETLVSKNKFLLVD